MANILGQLGKIGMAMVVAGGVAKSALYNGLFSDTFSCDDVIKWI